MGSKVRVVIAALASVIISISSVNTVIAKNKPAQKRDFRAVKTWKQGYKEGWALDRINQVHWRLDKVPLANENAGEGITIYVIDTGVGEEDCNGHGTVVASIAAGSEYGVAPAADIVSVKALNCEGSGTAADVIAAVEIVAEMADPETSVVNMSLGGPAKASVDAVVASLAERMPVVVAAGNESTDACEKTPARVPAAITVAGYDNTNLRSIFSNYGSCVDIWAPGTAVDGVDKNGDRVQWSGTSMTTAIISGAVAFIASRDGITTRQAADKMMQTAARPYLIDARLNGKSAYSLLIGN
jgi:subtilisin family serine protease